MNKKKKTIYDIAKITKLSPTAVSMALRDSPEISEKTKKLIKSVAKKLDFTPDSIAQALRSKKSYSIGVITLSIGNPFHATVFNAIQEVFHRENYSILIYNTDMQFESEITAIEKLLRKKIDGLVLFPRANDMKDLESLLETGFPFVLFGDHTLEDKIDYVINDNELGGYKLTKHLISLGHKRIAYLGYPNSTTSRERLSGYKKAMEENGFPVNEELTHMRFLQEKIPDIVMNILNLKDRPTAIVVFNDTEAIRLISALNEKGVKVPEDIAVVGFDNIEMSRLYNPPLTTVDNFAYEMGKKAAEILLDKINGNIKDEPQHIIIKPELVIRRSCGAYLKQRS